MRTVACVDTLSALRIRRQSTTCWQSPACPDPVTIDGPRTTVPADVPDLIALVDAAMRAGTEQTLLTDYPLVYAPENLHNVRVLRVDGELVSVVPVLPRDAIVGTRRSRSGSISPTATAPAHRHRGYASRCLGSAIEAMADAGCALSVLWTLVETFPFYEHAGYHPVVFQNEAVTLAGPDADAFARDPGIMVGTLAATDTATLDAIRVMHDADAGGQGIRRDARREPARCSRYRGCARWSPGGAVCPSGTSWSAKRSTSRG